MVWRDVGAAITAALQDQRSVDEDRWYWARATARLKYHAARWRAARGG